MTAVPKLDPDIKFLRFTWSSTCNVTRAKALFLPCCKDLQEIADVGIAMAAVNQVHAGYNTNGLPAHGKGACMRVRGHLKNPLTNYCVCNSLDMHGT